VTGPDAVSGAHLEYPDFFPRQPTFHVQGWVATRTPLVTASVVARTEVALDLRVRPDVLSTFPDLPHSIGFFGIARKEHLVGNHLTLRFVTASGLAERTFSLAHETPTTAQARRDKLLRLYPLLRCTGCAHAFPPDGYDGEAPRILCARCGASFDCSSGAFDLLSDGERSALAPSATDSISVHHYDPAAMQFVYDHRDGLVLDCGAGLRTTEYPHVVNLEVIPYRSTNVLGVNERLPFVDEAFDGVMSLAVLEHLRDPRAAAHELSRILKPGGRLLAVAPLLAPVHGYPHHYFNMTAAGLESLFSDSFEIQESAVPETGLPIWALTWMLRSWSDGLRGAARARFHELRVKDLLEDGSVYLKDDFVRSLRPETNFELAATTLLLAKKRG
jgi:SAM-dependent methyltransferase